MNDSGQLGECVFLWYESAAAMKYTASHTNPILNICHIPSVEKCLTINVYSNDKPELQSCYWDLLVTEICYNHQSLFPDN